MLNRVVNFLREDNFMGIDSDSENPMSFATTPLRRQDRDHSELRTQLEQWLAERLPGLGRLKIKSITAPESSGVANETLFIETGLGNGRGPHLVLRLEGSEFLYPESDLALHYEMYSCLGSMHSVPVPEMLAFEDNLSILGTRFMLMHRVRGRPVPDRPNFNYAGWLHDMSFKEQEAVWREAVTVMSNLHKVDITGLSGLQKSTSGLIGLVA
jgi:aminoglycoside phosphotransferase (APT) family kinase protein